MSKLLHSYGLHINAVQGESIPSPPVSNLPGPIQDKVLQSRFFIPIFTDAYVTMANCPAALRVALDNELQIAPVLIPSSTTLTAPAASNWRFAVSMAQVAILHDCPYGDVLAGLAHTVAPSSGVVPKIVDRMSASPLQCDLERLEESLQSDGAAQRASILAYCAYHYERLGMAQNANTCIQSAGEFVGRDTCPEIVKEVSLVNAQLQIARREFFEARATLTEAVMATHQWDEHVSPRFQSPQLRSGILAEIEKEIGRSLVDESHALRRTEGSTLQRRDLLEEAWCHFQIAQALLDSGAPESGRILGQVLDGIGTLMHHYGTLETERRLFTRARIPALQPTMQRLAGDPRLLFEEARKYLAESFRHFTNNSDRTGMGWSRYHQAELQLDTENHEVGCLRESEVKLVAALEDLEQNRLGSGLVHVQLYRVRTELFNRTGSKGKNVEAAKNASALRILAEGESPAATILRDVMVDMKIR